MAPAAIAVIGASPRGNRGRVILDNIRACGFGGRLYAVSPRHAAIGDLPCHARLADLPEVPDLVAIALPAAAAVAALREAAAAGVRAAVMIAGGFAEGAAAGEVLEGEIRAIARASGMRVCGPNCYGIVNVATGAAPYSGGIVDPLRRGNVGYVLQSGALTHALHDTLRGRGPGISAIVTSGNETVVELAEYVDWLLDDPGTEVVALFIEGLRDPGRFARVAEKALRVGKPIVALKVGRSDRGRRATLAHTGAVAGSDAACEGLFRKWGVIRAGDIDEMRETLVLLAAGRRPAAAGVAIASISGGVTTLLADLAEAAGLETPAPAPATLVRLRAALPAFGVALNPLDTTGALAEDPAILSGVATAFLDDPAIGCFALALNSPAGTPGHHDRARTLAAIQAGTDKPIVAFAVASAGVDADLVATLAAARIPLLVGARETMLALGRWIGLDRRRRAMAADRGRPAAGTGRRAELPAGPAVLAEHAASALLRPYPGLRFVAGERAGSAAAAVAAAARLGHPVALKIDSPAIAHKTEAGGVRLGLLDAGAVERAFAAIMAGAAAHAPGARLDGVLVQTMAPRGLEVLLGIARHAGFGLQLAVGVGGTLVEMLGEVALRPLPLTPADAEEMIDETRLGRLLEGFRGSGRRDRAALVAAILALSDAASDLGPRLEEVEINPLIVLAEGEGAVALDALAVLGPDPA